MQKLPSSIFNDVIGPVQEGQKRAADARKEAEDMYELDHISHDKRYIF